jgi:multiple sugar transport system permease protein
MLRNLQRALLSSHDQPDPELKETAVMRTQKTGGQHKSALSRKEAIFGYLMASPWILGFFFFVFGPLVVSFFMAFTNYRLADWQWVGFTNYTKLLGDDRLFFKALYNTIYYSVFAVPLGVLLALGVAILLNMPLPGMRVYRTLYYIPRVTPVVASSLLWLYLLHPASGPINVLLRSVGLPAPMWLSSPQTAKDALIVMSLWGVGGTAIIFLAALQGVPAQLYEAAEMDGANNVKRFWYITLPMISPTILFNLVVGIIGALQTFTQPFIMTDGGPIDSTLFYVLYLYRTGFRYLEMGYASAMAWVLFVIILILTLMVFRSSPLWVYYEGKREGQIL